MLKLISIYSSLAFVFILTSCASHEKGEYVYTLKGDHPAPMPITAFIDNSKSTDNFKLVNVHFKNESDHWVRVRSTQVKSINNKSILQVTTGDDLKAWQLAFLDHRAIKDHNDAMGFVGAVAVGAAAGVAGITSGSEELAVGGLALMHGATAVATVNEINENVEELENTKLQDQNFLYRPFSIPPGMTMRRWVLLQVSKAFPLNQMEFDIEYADARVVSYAVNLK